MKKMIVGIGLIMVMVLMVACKQTKVDNMTDTPMPQGIQPTEKMATEEDKMMGEDMDEEDKMMSEDMAEEEDKMMEDDMTEEEYEMMNDDVTMMNEGETAPDFTLMDTNGNEGKLSDLLGTKVYLKFWASWCPICLTGLEELNTLSQEMNDFKVITIVTPDFKGEKSATDFKEWWMGVEGVENIQVLLDVDGDVAKEYGILGFPTSAYIGTDGILVTVLPGHVDNEQVKNNMASVY